VKYALKISLLPFAKQQYVRLCGWLNDSQKACGYASAVVTKYQKRISGPLLDCIDIHIEAPK